MTENELRNTSADNKGVTDNDTVMNMIGNSNVNRVDEEENFSMGIVGGLLASFVCIVLWTAITVLTKYQIAYMSIGVGFAVGYAIQKFGKGRSLKFSILGAVLALLTCVAGNLASYVCMIVDEQPDYSYIEAFSDLNVEMASYIMQSFFQFSDLIFYGVAIYCGFAFSRKSD